METESGAKIAIRGKGSVKEGKGRSDAAHASNQEEDLHCLIMADTEDKVNKAKKLIHNVIETVSTPTRFEEMHLLNSYRLRPSLRARTSSSATNCASLPPSMEPCVMTRTRHARTVVRSVIASTIVQRSRTSPPASSVAFVVTQATWLVTVPTDREARTGATMLLAADHRLASVEEKQTLTMRYVILTLLLP